MERALFEFEYKFRACEGAIDSVGYKYTKSFQAPRN